MIQDSIDNKGPITSIMFIKEMEGYIYSTQYLESNSKWREDEIQGILNKHQSQYAVWRNDPKNCAEYNIYRSYQLKNMTSEEKAKEQELIQEEKKKKQQEIENIKNKKLEEEANYKKREKNNQTIIFILVAVLLVGTIISIIYGFIKITKIEEKHKKRQYNTSNVI